VLGVTGYEKEREKMGKMIFKIVLISLVFMGTGAFAKTKVALIGDSKKTNQVADLVLAKMSDNDKLEFLERSAIEKVLKEHKLQDSGLSSKQIPVIAKFLHADVFAVLSSAQINKKVVPSSLRVFDARNGFCLIDTALPSEIDKCANFVSTKLKNAVKILANPQSLKFVSILAVRNVGAPKKYKRQMAHIAIELERRLIAMPDVAVLERSELGLVNKERKISNKLFKLASSGYLLDLEFTPASSVNKVDLKIYILNALGKELTSFNFPDCLKTKPQQIIKALAKYLKSSPPQQIASNREEAKRFFQEYKHDTSDTAKNKLETAIALAPDNPKYLHELANYFQSSMNIRSYREGMQQRFMNALAKARRSMQICDEIKILFPNYDSGRRIPLYNVACFNTLSNLNCYYGLTDEQKAETQKFLKEFRPKSLRELRNSYKQFDLSDGINSFEELSWYNWYITYSCQTFWYLDFENYVSASYAKAFEHLKFTKSAILKNPDLMKNKIKKHIGFPAFFTGVMSYPSRELAYLMEDKIKNSHELIKLAKSHPLKGAQEYGYLLDLYRKLLVNNYDQKKFTSDLRVYLAKGFSPPSIIFRPILPRNHWNLLDVARREELAFKAKHGKAASGEMLMHRLRSAKDPAALADIIIDNADLVKKLRAKCVRSNFKNHYLKFAKELMKGLKGKEAKKCLKAINILNDPLLFEQLKTPKDFGLIGHKRNMLANAREYNGKIYLLFIGRFSRTSIFAKIFCFEPLKNKLSKIIQKNNIPMNRGSLFNRKLAFYIRDKYFLISNTEQILCIPRNGGAHSVIKDIPGKQIRDIVMFKNRIFAFAGRENRNGRVFAKETILFSCLPDGSDRRIHISTLRRDKKNFFDKQKPFIVSNLFVDKKNQRLLFVCRKPIGGLWEFDPFSGKYKNHIDFSTSYSSWGTKLKDKLYVTGGSNNSDYYIFDLISNKVDFIFYKWKSTRHLKQKPKFYANIMINSAVFFAREDQLWCGSWGINFISLNKKKIHLQYVFNLQGNRNGSVFPYPDGRSVWTVFRNSIYKITAPKKKKKELAIK
jgi:hypothetical protein